MGTRCRAGVRAAAATALLLGVPLVLIAQPRQGEPLNLPKIEALLKLKTPDSTLAAEISRRGLTFVPDRKTLERLESLGAGPLTIEAVDALRPILEDAKQEIPVLLKEIYHSLDQGDLQRVRALLAPELASDTRKLDTICKPFSYRAHYVESISERPNRRLEVRIRALFKPLDEKAYVLVVGFASRSRRFTVEDVNEPSRLWLDPIESAAAEVARKFAYAVIAGREDVAKGLASSGLRTTSLFVSSCQEAMGRYRDASLGQPVTRVENYKGLKVIVSLPAWGGDAFFVDQIDGQDKVVRYRAPCYSASRPVAAEDPSIEGHTLARFGLASPLESVERGATSVDDLQRQAASARAAGQWEEATSILREVLQNRGKVSIRVCRSRTFPPRCDDGRLELDASAVTLTDPKGKALFSVGPAQVTPSTPTVYGLRLRVADKDYNVSIVPQKTEGCVGLLMDGATWVHCDGAEQTAEQQVFSSFVAQSLRTLAQGQKR
jgi:hypothetical protein